MTDTVEHWYAAFTRPSDEERADRSLRQAGYATFLPLERVRRRKPVRGRPNQWEIVWEEAPLYPRYVFLGARAGQGLKAANEANGVSTVLHIGRGIDSRPAIIPHRVIDVLISLADANGIMDHRDLVLRRKRFEKGQKVMAETTSPWSGLELSVEWDKGDVVMTMMDLFGRSTPIEFRANQLRAI